MVGLPERVDAVLLDAGGVLVDLDYGYLRRLVTAQHDDVDIDLLSRSESLARRELERTVREGGRVGNLWREYFRTLLGHAHVPVEHHESIIDELWEAHQRVGLWTVAIPGACEAVTEIKSRGYRVGVISNAEGSVARDLDSAGFQGMFETVVDSALVGVEKPDPGIFGIALERMKLRAEHCVFLGDLPAVDVVGARAAGIAPILLDRHDLYPDESVPRLRSLGDLPSLLDGPERGS